MFSIATFVFAGNIKVAEDIQLTGKSQGEFYFPKFSPDGKSVFFTSGNFRGLWQLNLESGVLKQITALPGAGYKFVLTPDGKIIYFRTTEYKNKRRFHRLIEYNISTGTEKILEENERNLSPPTMAWKSGLFYLKNEKLTKINAQLSKTDENTAGLVYIENRNLILVRNGKKTILNPLGEGIYLWPSISPDGKKILFTLGGKGSYICDFNGKILTELGYANYPKWSPDGNWVLFMKDEDNGYNFTESDLYVKSSDGTEEFKLTSTDDIIELYGEWSPAGDAVVYHTDKGEIRLIKLKIEK